MDHDDMILVIVDDHMIEPPDMYRNHVPAKWADQVPKVVKNEQGIDQWVFQGEKTSTSFGMAATVGWPFRDHILACYITDPSGLLLRDRIGLDIIAWECDYPHTDTTGPESPEFAWKEFQDAGCSSEEIDRITWQNTCRFFDWDPFAHTPKEQATVAALRAQAQDVDTTRMSRAEWRQRNEAAGIGVF